MQKTKDFIKAANMEGFQSPYHLCEGQVGYADNVPDYNFPGGF